MKMGEAILEAARSTLGRGEEGKNNAGFWVNVFRRGLKVYGGGAWCAALASEVVETACYGVGMKKPYSVRHRSARRFVKRCERFGSKVADPRPGDIELRSRRGGMHVEIVEDVAPSGRRQNIAGNVGRYPARVKRVFRPPVEQDDAHVSFVRLREPLPRELL